MTEASERFSKNTLHVWIIIDKSGSMSVDGRIDQANDALYIILEQTIPDLEEKYNIDIMTKVIAYSDNAYYVVGDASGFADSNEAKNSFHPLTAGGTTNTADAYDLIVPDLNVQKLGRRALKPVMIHIADGGNNGDADKMHRDIAYFKRALSGNSGKEKITRVAIAVTGADQKELQEFASLGYIDGDETLKPLVFTADDIDTMKSVINCVTATSLISSISDSNDHPHVDTTMDDWGDTEA